MIRIQLLRIWWNFLHVKKNIINLNGAIFTTFLVFICMILPFYTPTYQQIIDLLISISVIGYSVTLAGIFLSSSSDVRNKVAHEEFQYIEAKFIREKLKVSNSIRIVSLDPKTIKLLKNFKIQKFDYYYLITKL